MVGWSEDHMVVIGSLNLNFALIDDLWLTWRPDGALRWKVKTTDWEGQGVVCGKPTSPGL
jgi:hypothetical protein